MTQLPTAPAAVDVLMQSWDCAAAGQRIGTSGAGPCIVIAAMNDTSGLAWVAHYTQIAHFERELTALFADIASRTTFPTDRLRIVISGGAISQGVKIAVRKDRHDLLRLLKRRLPQVDPTVHWACVPCMELDHSNGRWRETARQAPIFDL